MIQLEFNTTFPNLMPWPIAILNIRIDDLAQRLGLRVDRWDEDGLGEAKGFTVILPSGLWVMVTELQHIIDHLGGHGPTVEVLAEHTGEVDALLTEVLNAFALQEHDVQTRRMNNSDVWS